MAWRRDFLELLEIASGTDMYYSQFLPRINTRMWRLTFNDRIKFVMLELSLE